MDIKLIIKNKIYGEILHLTSVKDSIIIASGKNCLKIIDIISGNILVNIIGNFCYIIFYKFFFYR